MQTFSKAARCTRASTASLSYLNHNAVLNHVVKQVRVKWQTDFFGSGPTGGCGFCCDHDSPLVLCVPDLHHMQQHETLVICPVPRKLQLLCISSKHEALVIYPVSGSLQLLCISSKHEALVICPVSGTLQLLCMSSMCSLLTTKVSGRKRTPRRIRGGLLHGTADIMHGSMSWCTDTVQHK